MLLLVVLQQYMRYYEDPVIVRNTTPVSGRIQWARHLAERIEEPMEIFRQHPSVFDGAASRRVIQMYNRVSQVLLEYEMVWHGAWLKTIDVVDGGSRPMMHTPRTLQKNKKRLKNVGPIRHCEPPHAPFTRCR